MLIRPDFLNYILLWVSQNANIFLGMVIVEEIKQTFYLAPYSAKTTNIL